MRAAGLEEMGNYISRRQNTARNTSRLGPFLTCAWRRSGGRDHGCRGDGGSRGPRFRGLAGGGGGGLEGTPESDDDETVGGGGRDTVAYLNN